MDALGQIISMTIQTIGAAFTAIALVAAFFHWLREKWGGLRSVKQGIELSETGQRLLDRARDEHDPEGHASRLTLSGAALSWGFLTTSCGQPGASSCSA